MEEKVIEILENLTDYRQLRDDINIDLIENEILDSLAFIELITALEDEFNIEIQPTQVAPETWKNVKNIVKLIEKLVTG